MADIKDEKKDAPEPADDMATRPLQAITGHSTASPGQAVAEKAAAALRERAGAKPKAAKQPAEGTFWRDLSIVVGVVIVGIVIVVLMIKFL